MDTTGPGETGRPRRRRDPGGPTAPGVRSEI